MSQQAAMCLSDEKVREFVTDLYFIFAGRAPDKGGLDLYSGRILELGQITPVLEVFLNAPEYLAKRRREVLSELQSVSYPVGEDATPQPTAIAPQAFQPPGEAGRSYHERLKSGFIQKYCSGLVILDVGFTGYDNPERKAALPNAIGIDLDYPGYDGIRLPFDDNTVDTVFSSHCLEHILYDHAAIRDWYRVLKVGGFIVCMVPSQALYEKKRFLPSKWNGDHKRMYTPAGLAQSFETALEVNSYRVRHLAENDRGFDYRKGPDQHSEGAYEIEIVIEKIRSPKWQLEA